MVVAVGVGVGYHIAWTDSTVASIDRAFVFSGGIQWCIRPLVETHHDFPMCTRTGNKVRVEFSGLGSTNYRMLLTP